MHAMMQVVMQSRFELQYAISLFVVLPPKSLILTAAVKTKVLVDTYNADDEHAVLLISGLII